VKSRYSRRNNHGTVETKMISSMKTWQKKLINSQSRNEIARKRIKFIWSRRNQF